MIVTIVWFLSPAWTFRYYKNCALQYQYCPSLVSSRLYIVMDVQTDKQVTKTMAMKIIHTKGIVGWTGDEATHSDAHTDRHTS